MTLTDIYEVAMLFTEGLKHDKVEMMDGKIKFVFPDTAVPHLTRFYEGGMMVDAKQYKHAIQDVRSIIYGLKKSPVQTGKAHAESKKG